jgi:hypothetical protein
LEDSFEIGNAELTELAYLVLLIRDASVDFLNPQLVTRQGTSRCLIEGRIAVMNKITDAV